MPSYVLLVVIGTACLLGINGQIYKEYSLDPYGLEKPHIRVRRQLFGDFTGLPNGGNFQEVGYKTEPVWGSMSKTTDRFGFTSPIKYSGGFDFNTDSGLTGISGKFDSLSGGNSKGSIFGKVGLLDGTDHKVFGWGKHENAFDSSFKWIGSETNSAGLNYFNTDGAEGYFSITHTPGKNDLTSLGGKYPFTDGNGFISGKLDTTSGGNSVGSIRGDVGLVDSERFKVTGFAQHKNVFDKNFNRVGPETNSAGFNVVNKDTGATAFFKGSHTSGQRQDKGSVGVNVPISLTDNGKVKLELGGQSNFGQGMKPDHQFGATLKVDM